MEEGGGLVVTERPFYNRALKALQTAHDACFNADGRDVLGMSSGPFSGVNEALGIITLLERDHQELQEIRKIIRKYENGP